MPNTTQPNQLRSRCLRIGWALLALAVVLIGAPVLATAAQPHVLWLFTMSYGSVGLVVGSTLVRVGRGCPTGHTARQRRHIGDLLSS